MKTIILAGENETRVYPMTHDTNGTNIVYLRINEKDIK